MVSLWRKSLRMISSGGKNWCYISCQYYFVHREAFLKRGDTFPVGNNDYLDSLFVTIRHNISPRRKRGYFPCWKQGLLRFSFCDKPTYFSQAKERILSLLETRTTEILFFVTNRRISPRRKRGYFPCWKQWPLRFSFCDNPTYFSQAATPPSGPSSRLHMQSHDIGAGSGRCRPSLGCDCVLSAAAWRSPRP